MTWPTITFLLSLQCVTSKQHPDLSLSRSFEDWQVKFGKTYSSVEEKLHRMRIFEENAKRIDMHNMREDTSYTMGHNEFSDLTLEEWRRGYTQFHYSLHRNSSSTQPRHSSSMSMGGTAARRPDSIDWRKRNVVTAVKNQGHCGSCWAFSSTGAIEGAHAIAGNSLVSLSEQQIIDCEKSNLGCHGGLQPNSFVYVRDNGGIESESKYPYIQDKDDTKHSCRYEEKYSVATISDYNELEEGDEGALEDAVGVIGPVAIDMDAGGDGNFQFYKGGVFTSKECSSRMTDHAVLAVGYDVDRDKTGLEYWIVKNSWGSSWGMDGFFLIERGTNMCGVAQYCSYPIV